MGSRPQSHSGSRPTLAPIDSAYIDGIGAMFLVALVARILEPGCKADLHACVRRAAGRTEVYGLQPHRRCLFSDSLPDISPAKRFPSTCEEKWLIEIAEMSAMSRAEDAALKAFITRTTERYRPSYGRKEVVAAQAVLVRRHYKPVLVPSRRIRRPPLLPVPRLGYQQPSSRSRPRPTVHKPSPLPGGQ